MKRLVTATLFLSVVYGCGGKPVDAPQAESKTDQPDTQVAQAATPAQSTTDELIATADQFIAQRDLNNAVHTLNQAIQQDPRNAEAYIKRSAVFAEAKLLTKAADDMGIAIQLEPKSAKLRNTRGYFHLLRKDYEKAEADFNAAIDLNPQYPQALNNRGLVFIAIDKQVQAANDFKMAISLKPDYVDAYNNLGYISVEMDLLDEAINALTKAVELSPKYMNALTNRGRAYMKQRKYDAAIADYSTAIEIQPGNMELFAQRVEAYRLNKQTDLAMKDYKHIGWFQKLVSYNAQLVNTPKDASVWVARGRHLMLEQEYEAALDNFDKALTVQANYAEAYLGKAALHMEQKEFEKVIAECTKAIEQKSIPEAYSLRADAYFQTNNLDAAITDYNAGKRIDSQVVKAHQLHAAALEKAGNKELARHHELEAKRMEQHLAQTGKRDANDDLKPRAMKVQPVSNEETVTQ